MRLAIVGSALAGGAIQIVDILKDDYCLELVEIYDDREDAQGKNVLGVPVHGKIAEVEYSFKSGRVTHAVVAVGTVKPRNELYGWIKELGIEIPNIVSSKAIVSHSTVMGEGNIILPFTYIGPSVTIGDNNYITTGSVINHDTTIGSGCYFSTGVKIAGRVRIGDGVRLDTNSAVTADAHVVSDSHIQAGVCYGPLRGK